VQEFVHRIGDQIARPRLIDAIDHDLRPVERTGCDLRFGIADKPNQPAFRRRLLDAEIIGHRAGPE